MYDMYVIDLYCPMSDNRGGRAMKCNFLSVSGVPVSEFFFTTIPWNESYIKVHKELALFKVSVDYSK